MTPQARISTAIGLLDQIIAGAATEQVLTGWARASRFAGARDRAAVRDLVFDALRCRRSYLAASGQAQASGRALMIGALRAGGADAAGTFTGQGYAPTPLSAEERVALDGAPALADLPAAVALDCPDWLEAPLRHALAEDFEAVMRRMRDRAPIFLRVHAARATVAAAAARLAAEGIATRPCGLANFGLEVTENASRIRTSDAYLSGLVELQDAASQAAVEALPLTAGMRVLDYCAGGGGKTLAMAARVKGDWFAHDAAPRRMADLAARAARAGARVRSMTRDQAQRAAPFDLVLVDAPCSGSGTWRRAPEAKWTLTRERLDDLCRIQAEILHEVAPMVATGGVLAYMTCSLLRWENHDQVAAFLAMSRGFSRESERQFTPLQGGDGFYLACLRRG